MWWLVLIRSAIGGMRQEVCNELPYIVTLDLKNQK